MNYKSNEEEGWRPLPSSEPVGSYSLIDDWLVAGLAMLGRLFGRSSPTPPSPKSIPPSLPTLSTSATSAPTSAERRLDLITGHLSMFGRERPQGSAPQTNNPSSNVFGMS